MYIKKIYGTLYKSKYDFFEPDSVLSKNWYEWKTIVDWRTCEKCFFMNGRIISKNSQIEELEHLNCRCTLVRAGAIRAGNATYDGKNGADYWLKHYGKLPDYYVSREKYSDAGWINGKSPIKWFPRKMMYGGKYSNNELKLPVMLGRQWYEADINYYVGKRNQHRIYFSNDGLIFVSYNHGNTFYEII